MSSANAGVQPRAAAPDTAAAEAITARREILDFIMASSLLASVLGILGALAVNVCLNREDAKSARKSLGVVPTLRAP
jgi:hypothetical protein